MDEPEDQPMENVSSVEDEPASQLALSDDEQRALELYDRLQELRLEIAIINAQGAYQAERSKDPPTDVVKAQNDMLEARAKYRLRNDAIEAVMIANPILKAVHGGTNASPIERDLLPFVERRDDVARAVAKQATGIEELRDELADIQSQTSRVCRINVDLTAKLLELAEGVRQKNAGRPDDPETRDEMQRWESDLKSSKQRWRVMKGVASGIVAGSGVDWTQSDELREIVLDPEDEEED